MSKGKKKHNHKNLIRFTPEENSASFFSSNTPSLRQKLFNHYYILRTWLLKCLTIESAYGTSFLLIPFFIAIGIVYYFNISSEPSWLHISGVFAFLLISLVIIYKTYIWRLCFYAFLFILIGFTAAKYETSKHATIMLENNGFSYITGRLLDIEPYNKGGYRAIIEVTKTQSPKLAKQPQIMRLTLRHLPTNMKIGQGVAGFALLFNFSGPVRPHGYDFAFQNYFNGIGGQGILLGRVKSINIPPANWWQNISFHLTQYRDVIHRQITTHLHGEKGAIASALITGKRSGISEETNNALRQAGLAHILAISGLHMAMVTGMVLLICRFALSLFPVFSSLHPPKKIAAVIALFITAIYLLLSGAHISAERSFIMIAVMLLAVLLDRTAISLRNLAISAIILLLWQPHALMGPSFQMSFATTAALIAAFQFWSTYRQRKIEREVQEAEAHGQTKPIYQPPNKLYIFVRRWIAIPLISTCIASLLAGLAGGTFSAYHFNNTAPFGSISNVLALPIMSIFVMPFALIAMLLLPFQLEYLPLQIMGFGIDSIKTIAFWVASFSPRGNIGFIPPSSLIFFAIGVFVIVSFRSALRLLAGIAFGISFVLYLFNPLPLALISENGRVIGVFEQNKSLSINEHHSASYVLRNWLKSYNKTDVIYPRANISLADVQFMQQRELMQQERQGFACLDGACYARLRNGKTIVSLDKLSPQQVAHMSADVIVLNQMTTNHEEQSLQEIASHENKILITQRQLALFGAAAIIDWHVKLNQNAKKDKIIWSVGAPTRPWNTYRQFSKRARGMPA